MIESIIFLIVGLFFLLLCRIKTKTFINCGCVFIFMWTLVSVFSNLQLYNFEKPSLLVNCCMFLGITIMGILYSIFGTNYNLKSDMIKNMDVHINIRILILVNFLVLLYLFPFFVKSINLIINNSFTYLRSLYGIASSETGQTSFSNLFISSICYPSILATEIIGVIYLYLKKKNATLILGMGTVNLIVYSIMGASRNGFIILVFFIVVGYFKIGKIIKKEKTKCMYKSKKKKKLHVICNCI